MQKIALKQAGIPYKELQGSYTIEKIRKIYRQTSIFFISFRESFGLPICEIQACGGLIATPFPDWTPSHWIKQNINEPGPGRLGSNFIVYDNNMGKLLRCLMEARRNWNPLNVRNQFISEYGKYYFGDSESLKKHLIKLNMQSN
jgi:hypothetical protein